MDELFYLTALITGIVGGFVIWNYSRKKKTKLIHAVQERTEEKEK